MRANRSWSHPIQQNLEATLVDLSQMPTDSLDDQANAAALDGHKALKTYLMLATRAVSMQGSSRRNSCITGARTQTFPSARSWICRNGCWGFTRQHLKAHDAWRIQPRPELVNASRQTLLSVIGVRNSEDTVYQSMLAGVGNKYPDQTLASLTTGTDTRGLIRTSVACQASTRGKRTRATSQRQSPKRPRAVTSRVTGCWLTRPIKRCPPHQRTPLNSHSPRSISTTTPSTGKGFMNALQWQAAPNIPAAIEQMKLLADARQSPVIALMKSLDYQGTAGGASGVVIGHVGC
jgi:type VI secretion system protein ImpL